MIHETTENRTVVTPGGTVSYTLTRKRVKNWNLRVRDGRVFLSVPPRVSDAQADGFVRDRADWIARALARQEGGRPLPPTPERTQCLAILTAAVERALPSVAPLGVARPQVRVRRMKSQWGNCHWRQGYVTLNTLLAACPEELQDYVALHELVHFLHPNHGAGFHALMDRLMPDWRRRRATLRQYRM